MKLLRSVSSRITNFCELVTSLSISRVYMLLLEPKFTFLISRSSLDGYFGSLLVELVLTVLFCQLLLLLLFWQ